MIKAPNSYRKTLQPREPPESPGDIFARLAQRGIDYSHVKVIVQFYRPQYPIVFGELFKGHTITKVLKQLDEWKAVLKNDFVLSRSKDLKAQVEQSVIYMERLVWSVLITVPQVGPWELQILPLPSSLEKKGRPIYIFPALEIRAVHRETKEIRWAEIPGGSIGDLASQGDDFKRAFEKLGLWGLLAKAGSRSLLISKRSPQGWPICTRLIIPRLYEFMLPNYPASSHQWDRHRARQHAPKTKPLAQYPTDLLTDMLEILHLEDPYLFGKMTLHQLKSAVQRHLTRKRAA